MKPGPAAAAAALLLALCGCGSHTIVITRPPTFPLGATPSTGTPGGAMAGFLGAAFAQDNSKVTSWLATTADTTDLAELLKVYSNFGTSGASGLFWAVDGVRIVRVTSVDATHASVALTGDIVWCLGASANDPAASCAAVTGVPGMQHTYPATSTDGTWRVDVDVNAGTELDHNPQASPTAGEPSPSAAGPSPTPS